MPVESKSLKYSYKFENISNSVKEFVIKKMDTIIEIAHSNRKVHKLYILTYFAHKKTARTLDSKPTNSFVTHILTNTLYTVSSCKFWPVNTRARAQLLF